MKVNYLIVLLTLYSILFSACKKKLNTPDATVVKLKYLQQVIKKQGSSTLVTNYTYDDKKRITTIKSTENTTTYTYSGNILTYMESISTNGDKEYTDFTYTGGVISSVRFRTNKANPFGSDVTYYYYRENGRITEAHYDGSVDKYTYDSRGNIINIFFGSVNMGWFYKYDEKPSRFTNGFPKYVVNFNVESLGPNNEIVRPNLTTTYTYGSDGYPISALQVLNAGAPSAVTTNITYTYATL